MTFTIFGMALGKYDALAQLPTGGLTADLNQWKWLVFKYGKETVYIPVADVFAALKEGLAKDTWVLVKEK